MAIYRINSEGLPMQRSRTLRVFGVSRGTPKPGNLVKLPFMRVRRNPLWVTDVADHRSREGTSCCAEYLQRESRGLSNWLTPNVPLVIKTR